MIKQKIKEYDNKLKILYKEIKNLNNDINTAQDFTYPDVSRINIDVTQR